MPRIQRRRLSKENFNSQKITDKFYQNRLWRLLRDQRLIIDDGLCQYCLKKGYVEPAYLVDHYYPRRLFPELELEIDFLRSCCRSCDGAKRKIEGQSKSREQAVELILRGGFTL